MAGEVQRVERLAAKLSWRRLPWALEIGSILFFYGLYAFVRVLVPNRVGAAFDNAAAVTQLEKALGVFPEIGLNAFLSRHEVLEVLASWYYVTLHYVVTTAVLVWLWTRRHHVYAPLRSALVIASASALVIYAAWPLAPPRYATAGTVDTVSIVLNSSGHGVSGLVNDIAAMPSMHVGWALWCAVVLVSVLRSRWRHLAWLYPICTTAVVVATANHYIADAVAGALVVAVPLYLCGLRHDRIVRLQPVVEPAPVQEACAA